MNSDNPRDDNAEANSPAKDSEHAPDARERVFLVIVDDSEELERALYFACRRAKRLGGRVALLYCEPPTEGNHFMGFMGIGERLEAEGREKAEQLMSDLSEKVHRWSGKMAIVLIEQDIEESLPQLLERENIMIIIQPMPMPMGKRGGQANHWATYLLEGGAAHLHIPVTMVPPTMTIEDINRLA